MLVIDKFNWFRGLNVSLWFSDTNRLLTVAVDNADVYGDKNQFIMAENLNKYYSVEKLINSS